MTGDPSNPDRDRLHFSQWRIPLPGTGVEGQRRGQRRAWGIAPSPAAPRRHDTVHRAGAGGACPELRVVLGG